MKYALIILNIILITSLSFFFLSCGEEKAEFISKENILELAEIDEYPDAEDYPNADAVILYEFRERFLEVNPDAVTFEGMFSSITTIHWVKKVFKNIEEYSETSYTIDEYDELIAAGARVIHPDGTVYVLGPKDVISNEVVVERSGFRETNYTLNFPNLVEGSIIEFTLKLKWTSVYGSGRFYVQNYDEPKLYSHFKLSSSNNWKAMRIQSGFLWKTEQSELDYKQFPQPEVEGSKECINWIYKKIPAFKPEKMMSAHLNHRANIVYVPKYYKSWNMLSKGFWNGEMKEHLENTDSVKYKALELCDSTDSEETKIANLFHYVRKMKTEKTIDSDDMYYMTSPKTIIEREFGERFEKNLLLITLLKSMDIKAYPAMLRTDDEQKIDEGFPEWKFSRMITYVKTKDKKELWLDPSLDYQNVQDIPFYIEGLPALVILDNGSSLFYTIGKSKCEENKRIVDINVNIDENGNSEVKVKSIFFGEWNYLIRYRMDDEKEEDIVTEIKDLFFNDDISAGITDLKFTEPDSLDEIFEISFTMNSDKIVENQGSLVMLNFDVFNFFGYMKSLIQKDERKYPIVFSYPETVQKNVNVIYPADKFKIDGLPKENAFKTGKLYFESKVSQGNGFISSNIGFIIKEDKIKTENFKDVKDFFKNSQQDSEQKIILKKL